jgi:hypothetical protein
MAISTDLISRIDRKLAWGAVLWFLWGVSGAIGRWLSIGVLKMDKASSLVWFGFGFLLMAGVFVADCAKAVVATIREQELDKLSASMGRLVGAVAGLETFLEDEVSDQIAGFNDS